MVRFKNRYLLVELVPIHISTQDRPATHPPKKARFTDLITEDPVDQPTDDPIRDPTANAALFQGLSSASAASYIRQSLETNFGVYASAINSQSFSVKYCNARTGTLLVRAARSSLEQVWSSITFLTNLPPEITKTFKSSANCKFNWRVVHVSGTIRSAQKHAIVRSTRKIQEALKACTDETKRAALEAVCKEAEQALAAVEA